MEIKQLRFLTYLLINAHPSSSSFIPEINLTRSKELRSEAKTIFRINYKKMSSRAGLEMTNKEAARVHRVINQDIRLSHSFPCLRFFFEIIPLTEVHLKKH